MDVHMDWAIAYAVPPVAYHRRDVLSHLDMACRRVLALAPQLVVAMKANHSDGVADHIHPFRFGPASSCTDGSGTKSSPGWASNGSGWPDALARALTNSAVAGIGVPIRMSVVWRRERVAYASYHRDPIAVGTYRPPGLDRHRHHPHHRYRPWSRCRCDHCSVSDDRTWRAGIHLDWSLPICLTSQLCWVMWDMCRWPCTILLM